MPPAFQDTLNFLSQATVWPDPADSVQVRDTHWSVVFLTERHAYKIKKPVRRARVDFTAIEARQTNCVAEIRLNRRLAPQVYLGLVALLQWHEGLFVHDLTLEHPPTPGPTLPGAIDWLVKMVRLPADAMLDQIIRTGALQHRDVVAMAQVLSNFYRSTVRINVPPAAYLRQQVHALHNLCLALRTPGYGLDGALIAEIEAAQRHFIASHPAYIEVRAASGHIVEAHGDLRPEHVCLAGAPPLFIDCLEFDRSLRIADPADELAGLSIECGFMGAPEVGPWLMETYRQASGDAVSDAVVKFYGVQRALARARMAAWHLDDPMTPALRDHWRARAAAYLQLAWAHLVERR